MSNERKIEKKVRIRATRAAVWKALTEGEQIARWFAPEAKVTPGVGGKIWTSWGGGMEGESPITIWEPERRLQTAASDGGPRTIDYFLEGEGGETTLRLVHSGFGTDAKWDDEFDAYDRGWSIFVLNLKHATEEHAGRGCVQSLFTASASLSREQAWQPALEALGFKSKAAAPREGDAFVVGGLEGRLEIFSPARDLAGVLPGSNDALLRVSFEKAGEGTWVCGVLLAYGGTPDLRPAAQKLEAALRQALPKPA